MTLGCSIFDVLNNFDPVYDDTREIEFEGHVVSKWTSLKHFIKYRGQKHKPKQKDNNNLYNIKNGYKY